MSDKKLQDYAVEKSDTPFKDGAYWRWSQAHIPAGTRSHIARVGDMIVLDPAGGLRVVSPRTFAATHEETSTEETWEYIAEWCNNGVWEPIEMEMFDGVLPSLAAARGYIKVAKARGTYENTRIVRRLVSEQEIIK